MNTHFTGRRVIITASAAVITCICIPGLMKNSPPDPRCSTLERIYGEGFDASGLLPFIGDSSRLLPNPEFYCLRVFSFDEIQQKASSIQFTFSNLRKLRVVPFGELSTIEASEYDMVSYSPATDRVYVTFHSSGMFPGCRTIDTYMDIEMFIRQAQERSDCDWVFPADAVVQPGLEELSGLDPMEVTLEHVVSELDRCSSWALLNSVCDLKCYRGDPMKIMELSKPPFSGYSNVGCSIWARNLGLVELDETFAEAMCFGIVAARALDDFGHPVFLDPEDRNDFKACAAGAFLMKCGLKALPALRKAMICENPLAYTYLGIYVPVKDGDYTRGELAAAYAARILGHRLDWTVETPKADRVADIARLLAMIDNFEF